MKRVFGWILCFAGFSMITSIITTTADITLNWIPLLGGLATSLINLGVTAHSQPLTPISAVPEPTPNCEVFIANFVLATATATITAAVAWVWYRPVLGATLLAGAVGLLYVANKAGEKAGPASRNIKLDD